jgi:hypothetical protein
MKLRNEPTERGSARNCSFTDRSDMSIRSAHHSSTLWGEVAQPVEPNIRIAKRIRLHNVAWRESGWTRAARSLRRRAKGWRVGSGAIHGAKMAEEEGFEPPRPFRV